MSAQNDAIMYVEHDKQGRFSIRLSMNGEELKKFCENHNEITFWIVHVDADHEEGEE